jgi:hypothetical protein
MEGRAIATYVFLMSHMEKVLGQSPVTVMTSSFDFDSSGEQKPKISQKYTRRTSAVPYVHAHRVVSSWRSEI